MKNTNILALTVLIHLLIIAAISLPLYFLPVGELCLRLWELYHLTIIAGYILIAGMCIGYAVCFFDIHPE